MLKEQRSGGIRSKEAKGKGTEDERDGGEERIRMKKYRPTGMKTYTHIQGMSWCGSHSMIGLCVSVSQYVCMCSTGSCSHDYTHSLGCVTHQVTVCLYQNTC